jgi:hypothetical protein
VTAPYATDDEAKLARRYAGRPITRHAWRTRATPLFSQDFSRNPVIREACICCELRYVAGDVLIGLLFVRSAGGTVSVIWSLVVQ